MKLNKNKINFKKILELNLIKSRIYENTAEKNQLVKIKLTKIVAGFKKAILLIFNYHKKNKNILFIGTPKEIEDKINLKTNHVSIPNSINIQNFTINKSIIKGIKLKQKILKKNKYVITKTKNKPDLIVVFDQTYNKSIIDESYSYRIPIIVFNTNEKEMYKKYSYCVFENSSIDTNKNISHLFFVMLNAMLKI